MGYRKALLFRWSRRDRLTIVVVAVTTAFLLGTTLLLFTAVTYSETFAEPLSNSATVTYESTDGEPPQTDADQIVLPLAAATANGEQTIVVGISPDAPRTIQNGSAGWQRARLPKLSAEADGLGPVSSPSPVRLNGTQSQQTLSIRPHDPRNQFLSQQWFVTNASTAETLGVTGYFVIDTDSTGQGGWSSVPETGVPLVSALLFVLGGLEQVLWALGIAVGAGGLLILVVVYSVTRMSVRDRINAIQVIRSTGAPGWQVGLLFTVRATLLVLIGVALGYASGLIAIKAIVNTAVYFGLPIALNVAVTGQSVAVVSGVALALICMGVLAGGLAAYPTATRPPARLSNQPTPAQSGSAGGQEAGITTTIQDIASPSLLAWQALIPTTATLTVFALTFLLVFSVAGLAIPLDGGGAGTGTITEANAAHPLNSRLDAAYAGALRANGTPASPEIIYAQVHDGQPYMAHGARYPLFANVTGATLVNGQRPSEPDEAVIGKDLAQTLDVSVGETFTVGGSVSPGVRRVEIVGKYTAAGTIDDLLIIPLETADDLATREGTVHMIRVAGSVSDLGTEPTNRSGTAVTGLTGPSRVTRGSPATVTVTVRNFGQTDDTRTVTVTYRNESQTATVQVPAGSQRTVDVTFNTSTYGTAVARASGYTHSITVSNPNAIQIPDELPATAPPGSGLYVPVVSPDGERVTNASVTLNQLTLRTGPEGTVLLPLPSEPGTYTITANKGNQTSTHEVQVVPGQLRQLSGRLRIAPQSGNVLTTPTMTVELANPWQRAVTRQVTVVGPGTARERTVTIDSGNATRTKFAIGQDTQLTPGTYTFELVVNGTVVTSADYTVTGDTRLAAAVASSGQYARGSPIERSIEGVFGNIQLILVAFVALAGLSSVGSTTATFAQAVHARRQAIGVYRSTGATQGRILVTVLQDVVRIAVPATIIAAGLAVVVMIVLERAGWLVFFGFRLSTTAPPKVLVTIVGAGVLLAVFGAGIATIPYVRASPVSLLKENDRSAQSSQARVDTTSHIADSSTHDDAAQND